MARFRFSIASLLAVVLVLAVGFAAMREATEVWSSSIFTLTLGALLCSVLLAIHRAAARRAFWVGFALFGWGYLVLSLVPSVESRLLTAKGLAFLDSKVPGRSPVMYSIRLTGPALGSFNTQIQAVAFSPSGNQVAASSPGLVRVWNAATGKLLQGWSGTTENFVNIGHSLIALLAGCVGGVLSRLLRRSLSSPEPVTPIDPSGGRNLG
jgi:hypothetical protein